MQTMNISLPDPMKEFIDEQVRAEDYSSASEYLRQLVRAAQKVKAKEHLESLLLEALQSKAEEATPEYWRELKREAIERMERSKSNFTIVAS